MDGGTAMTGTENNVSYRKLLWPANLQGIGIGIALGVAATLSMPHGEILAVFVGLVATTLGYVFEKKARNSDTDTDQ